MIHVNIKSAAKASMAYAVDLAVSDLPRVNVALLYSVAEGAPFTGPIEGVNEVLVYPADVQALGLPAVPRFYGELQFERCPGSGLSLINGSLSGQLPMRCQACLIPFVKHLKIDVRLAHISREDQESSVPEDYEPLLLDGQDVTFVDMLEDDILLALPIFPKHNPGECQPLIAVDKPITIVDDNKKPSPFSGLKALLDSPDEGKT